MSPAIKVGLYSMKMVGEGVLGGGNNLSRKLMVEICKVYSRIKVTHKGLNAI